MLSCDGIGVPRILTCMTSILLLLFFLFCSLSILLLVGESIFLNWEFSDGDNEGFLEGNHFSNLAGA